MTPSTRIRKAACNTGFASGRVMLRQAQHNTCKIGVFCIYSSSVLVDPERFRDAQKPARTQSLITLGHIK